MFNKKSKLKHTIWLLLFCFAFGIFGQGKASELAGIDFRTSGRVSVNRYATMNNWRKNNFFLQTLGDTRLQLNFNVGNSEQPIFVYWPLYIQLNQYRPGMSQLTASSAVISDYIMMFQKEAFQLSLTSRGAYYKNQSYAFNNLKDPLGALAYPNSDVPNMTLKFTGKMPSGWDLKGYYLADTRTNYLPRIETIPDAVYPAIGRTKENMLFYDEMATFTMYRATKNVFNNTFGILYGKKEAVNISPRAADNELTVAYPKHGVGYSKENYGLDYSGKLNFANKPDFAIALVCSSGEWRKYKKDLAEFWEAATWDSLGKLEGNAVKAEFQNLELGKLNFSGSYHKVDPDFQMIAVRHSRYDYFYDSSTYGRGVTSQRALLDKEFKIRNAHNRGRVLSDISTYFGLSALQASVEIPGEIELGKGGQSNEAALVPPLALARAILNQEVIYDYRNLTVSEREEGVSKSPVDVSFALTKIENLNRGATYFDPKSNLKLSQGYLQLRTDIGIGYSENTDLNVFARERNYGSKQNYYRDLGLRVVITPIPSLSVEAEAVIANRARPDNRQEEGTVGRGKMKIEGVTLKGIRLGSTVDYRYGNYDLDLTAQTEDLIFANPYSYLCFKHYLEFAPKLKLGSISPNTVVAGEMRKYLTDFPGINEGITYIGHLYSDLPLREDLAINFTGVGIKGTNPVAAWYDFSMGQMLGYKTRKNSYINWALTYRPFASTESKIILNHTTSFEPNLINKFWNIVWETHAGKHLFYIHYRSDLNWFQVAWNLYF